MGADSVLVNAALSLGMSRVPKDTAEIFNKQYEGLIAYNQAKADTIVAGTKALLQGGMAITNVVRKKQGKELLEPLDFEDVSNPVELLKIALEDRIPGVLVTAFSLKNARAEQLGTRLVWKANEISGKPETLEPKLLEQIQKEFRVIYGDNVSSLKQYENPEEIWVFYEVLSPTIHLFLFGAGNDTIPVAKMASLLGWELTLIDGRKNHATSQRFPTASKIFIEPADKAVGGLKPDKNTVALLMTHNFEYEAVVLKDLIPYSLPYIGILGPKKKTDKLIARLESEGTKVPTENIYAPIGLDIGAEGSEEIALSALAEIKAVLANKKPDFLRNKIGPIHEDR